MEDEEVREMLAKPPLRREKVLPEVPTATVGGKTAPKSMGEKESKDLARYPELSLSIFNKLRVLGVEMDLLDLVKKEDGSINGDRFSIHTSPNRASTGLRYARLMMNLLVWSERDERPLPEDSVPCNKLSLLDYVESIIQEGCGCHTPHAVLLAWDFYGKAFGFSPHGGHFGRAKRLASKCTSQAVGGRVGAPLFSKEVMNALECMVLDPFPQIEVGHALIFGSPIAHKSHNRGDMLRCCITVTKVALAPCHLIDSISDALTPIAPQAWR